MRFGTLCQARREAKRLTLTQLGDRISVHSSHLGRFERGQAGLSVDRIERLLFELDLVVVPREQVHCSDLSEEPTEPASLAS